MRNCSFGSGVSDDGTGIGICRYALDVHTDRAEDVLTHKRLLEEAKVPEKRPVFHVRAVQVSIFFLVFCSSIL